MPERVQVMAPYPLSRPLDYVLPRGMKISLGDYVSIPLGRRQTAGVVWSLTGDANVPAAKLKPVQARYDLPPMTDVQRRFIDWVARYTLSDAGTVLKMAVSVPEALDGFKQETAYLAAAQVSAKLTAARARVLNVLHDGLPRKAADLAREAGCSVAVIKAMATAGLLVETVLTPARKVPPAYVTDDKHVTFSSAQRAAADALRDAVAGRAFSAQLLDGVTGSGKTEVYFAAVAEALKQGRQVLILLPEIALSSQFVDRFTRRFGAPPALWHSEVTPARKRDTWIGVAEGRVPVVVGARSALFLPFPDLGLIVVDEEHDASYKQEEGVLYNARDMAVVRAHLGDAAVVLVSATPSLETMTNVRQEKYGYLHLPDRHGGAVLPQMHIVDLKATPPDRQKFIAPPLREAIRETVAAGEQALLFLNRRGYAPLTLCRTCGHRFQCPSCSAWLVEHKRHNKLQCHHCGFAQAVPKDCPSCHDDQGFAACGPGVERIEEEVREVFPDARTLVLASDLMTSGAALTRAIEAIAAKDIDIIIGTQIVAKGHHFPDLTLVGVIDADLGLAGGDLRAGERTFQLLHQVAGRAGRASKAGRVMLQTFMPEQAVIRALAAHDRDAFLAAESAERERAGMPPFGKLAGVIVSATDVSKLDIFCRQMAQAAPRYADIRVLGPAPAPLALLRGQHRRRFLVKTGRDVNIQRFMQEWLSALAIPPAVTVKVDIDPQSFF